MYWILTRTDSQHTPAHRRYLCQGSRSTAKLTNKYKHRQRLRAIRKLKAIIDNHAQCEPAPSAAAVQSKQRKWNVFNFGNIGKWHPSEWDGYRTSHLVWLIWSDDWHILNNVQMKNPFGRLTIGRIPPWNGIIICLPHPFCCCCDFFCFVLKRRFTDSSANEMTNQTIENKTKNGHKIIKFYVGRACELLYCYETTQCRAGPMGIEIICVTVTTLWWQCVRHVRHVLYENVTTRFM